MIHRTQLSHLFLWLTDDNPSKDRPEIEPPLGFTFLASLDLPIISLGVSITVDERQRKRRDEGICNSTE
jgi:hypothetical protein